MVGVAMICNNWFRVYNGTYVCKLVKGHSGDCTNELLTNKEVL